MHKIVNPQQTRLFDPFDSVLTEKTRKSLLNGWTGVPPTSVKLPSAASNSSVSPGWSYHQSSALPLNT